MNMRRWGLSGVTLAACAAGLLVYAADVFKQLGMTEAEARQAAVTSFTQGYVPIYPASKAIKAAAPAVRVALITGVLTFVKSYTESAEFAQGYLKAREEAKPKPPELKSADDEWAKMLKDTEKSIEEMKKAAANPAQTPEMRKMFEQMAQQQTQQYEKFKADANMKAIVRQTADAQGKADTEQYQARLKEWEARYPADPKMAVARRLRQFLAVSATVDYGAQLTTKGSRQVFVNPKYRAGIIELEVVLPDRQGNGGCRPRVRDDLGRRAAQVDLPPDLPPRLPSSAARRPGRFPEAGSTQAAEARRVPAKAHPRHSGESRSPARDASLDSRLRGNDEVVRGNDEGVRGDDEGVGRVDASRAADV